MNQYFLGVVLQGMCNVIRAAIALLVFMSDSAYAACDCVGSWSKHVLEEIPVPGSGQTVYSATTLRLGRIYYFKASGTYSYWPSSSPYGDADAECSNRPPYSFGPGWVHPSALGQAGGQVLVDGRVFLWGGSCSELEHVYIAPYVGEGKSISFSILDDYYVDNFGGLSVEIYECI